MWTRISSLLYVSLMLLWFIRTNTFAFWHVCLSAVSMVKVLTIQHTLLFSYLHVQYLKQIQHSAYVLEIDRLKENPFKCRGNNWTSKTGSCECLIERILFEIYLKVCILEISSSAFQNEKHYCKSILLPYSSDSRFSITTNKCSEWITLR